MCDETLYSRLSVKKASLKASIGYGSKQEVWAKIECLIFCTDVLVQKFLTSPSLMPPPHNTHTMGYITHTTLCANAHTHTGKEVALYCSAHIPELLVASSVYKSGNVPLALQKTFLECDRLLTTPQAVEEMEKLLLNDRKDQGESE